MNPTLVISLAYKYVATAVMVTQVNLAVEQLGLPFLHPVSEKDVEFIAPPRLVSFGGSVVTESFFFGFTDRGLAFIESKNFYPRGRSIVAEHEKHATRKSLVNTNQAYQLAKEWLRAMDLNLVRLEAECDPVVSQRFYYLEGGAPFGPLPTNGPTRSLPIFDVEWRARNPPAHRQGKGVVLPSVSVAIYGPTKQLIHLRLEDSSFSSRTAEPVKDFEALLAIPDEEFLRFPEAERQRLLERHLALPRLRPSESASGSQR